MIIILFISFLLIIKQMQVWKLEHSESMYIMELFGAPFWLRSVKLLKLAVIDSILAVIMIYFILFYISNSEIYLDILSQLGIKIDVNIVSDILKMLLISFTISMISTLIVINSKRSNR
jgi:cell division transport system permease protein